MVWCVYRVQRLKYSVYLKSHKASCFGGVRAVTTEASFLLCAFMDDFSPGRPLACWSLSFLFYVRMSTQRD